MTAVCAACAARAGTAYSLHRVAAPAPASAVRPGPGRIGRAECWPHRGSRHVKCAGRLIGAPSSNVAVRSICYTIPGEYQPSRVRVLPVRLASNLQILASVNGEGMICT